MTLSCARCGSPLPAWELEAKGAADCTACGSENRVAAFPALLKPAEAARGETALAGEAACFDHPGKRAVAACSQCGRFVCQLCAVEFGEGVWCPSCVAAGAGQARAARAETARNLYDSTALTVPLLSLLLWPLTIIAGPAAVVLAVMKWREPLSLVRRSRWRFFAAIAVGLAETAGWAWGIVYLAAHAGAKP